MRFAFAKLSVALVALLCVSAAGATMAQAASGPLWLIGKTYLGLDESRELNEGSGEFSVSAEFAITCTKQSYEKASIEGSNPSSAGAIKVAAIFFSGCTVKGNGTGCTVSNPIKTQPLEGHLAFATKERTGKIFILLGSDGTSKKVWWIARFNGAGCFYREYKLEGSAALELVTAGTPDEVGKEAEAKVQQARFPASEVRQVWVEKEGKLTEEPVGLELSGSDAVASGVSNLEIKSGGLWGALTK